MIRIEWFQQTSLDRETLNQSINKRPHLVFHNTWAFYESLWVWCVSRQPLQITRTRNVESNKQEHTFNGRVSIKEPHFRPRFCVFVSYQLSSDTFISCSYHINGFSLYQHLFACPHPKQEGSSRLQRVLVTIVNASIVLGRGCSCCFLARVAHQTLQKIGHPSHRWWTPSRVTWYRWRYWGSSRLDCRTA